MQTVAFTDALTQAFRFTLDAASVGPGVEDRDADAALVEWVCLEARARHLLPEAMVRDLRVVFDAHTKTDVAHEVWRRAAYDRIMKRCIAAYFNAP